ncbi:hypothetical protein KT99_02382, partial [Shewanella benthica KT99]
KIFTSTMVLKDNELVRGNAWVEMGTSSQS